MKKTSPLPWTSTNLHPVDVIEMTVLNEKAVYNTKLFTTQRSWNAYDLATEFPSALNVLVGYFIISLLSYLCYPGWRGGGGGGDFTHVSVPSFFCVFVCTDIAVSEHLLFFVFRRFV